MTGNHSCWPLFGDDLKLARDWIKLKLNCYPIDVRIGHQALSLGLIEEVIELLGETNRFTEVAATQLEFRIARLNNEQNPYDKLLTKTLKQQVGKIINKEALLSNQINVAINGGIGDHLEALSLVLPWAENLGIKVNLHIDKKRQSQLSSILSKFSWINLETIDGIPILALRGWIKENTDNSYESWIRLNNKSIASNKLVCCWKAEGSGDKFSAYCRSIPFNLVYEFYEFILGKKNYTIQDISNWNLWEREKLMYLGINILNPNTGNLLDLARVVENAKVVTIDTALAHLCAAMGHKAIVLLPRFADERWIELNNQGSSYATHLTLLRNQVFGNWKPCVGTLIQILLG